MTHARTIADPLGLLLLAAYVSTIVLANWLIEVVGIVPVGFGLTAPAGAYCAGIALTCRDAVQERMGRAWAAGAIVAGAAASLLLAAPQLALASGVAFLLSEGADMLVYTPLRERGRLLLALLLSDVVGLIADSALFLWVAFGSLEYLPGQALAKLASTAVAVALWLTASAIARRGRR